MKKSHNIPLSRGCIAQGTSGVLDFGQMMSDKVSFKESLEYHSFMVKELLSIPQTRAITLAPVV